MSAGLIYSSQPCPLGLLQGEPGPEWGDQVNVEMPGVWVKGGSRE